jgi:hypothetical protein
MAYFWRGLRSGEWLTSERVRGYSLILLGVCVLAAAGWLVLSDSLIDRNGKPLGTDFSSFYAAGSLVLDGRAADVYNAAAHHAREQQIFGAATLYCGWLYPPIFLLLATPLALLRYPLVVPVALLAAGQWRAVAAAGIAVMAMVGMTILIFGADPWLAFAVSTETSRKLLLEQGDVGFEKLQSAFAVVRMWGGGVPLTYAVQGATSAAVVCGTAWIWRSACGNDLKAAVLVVATLLASPHVLDYDLVMLALAIAFTVSAGFAAGFRNYEISLLAAAWIVPLLSRSIAGVTGIPLGLLVLLAFYSLILRRAVQDRAGFALSTCRIAQA